MPRLLLSHVKMSSTSYSFDSQLINQLISDGIGYLFETIAASAGIMIFSSFLILTGNFGELTIVPTKVTSIDSEFPDG